MKGRALLLFFVGIVALLTATTASALESGEFAALLAAGQYQEVASMCNKNAAAIATHPDSGEIMAACAQAKAALAGGGEAPSAPIPEPPPVEPPALPSGGDILGEPEPPAVPGFGDTSGGILGEGEPEVPDVPAPSEPVPTFTETKTESSPSPMRAAAASSLPNMTGEIINPSMFQTPYGAEQYDNVIGLCEQYRSEIMSHADRDLILKVCGQAKVQAFNKTRIQTNLTGAMGDLENSLKSRYDNVATFDLGMARLRTVDTIPKEGEKKDEERKAILEMFDALVNRHATENFANAVSDQIIVWTIGNIEDDNSPGYTDMLIERVIKNEDDLARLRWLSARIRMLSDRFTIIDPKNGENETRQQNLDTVKFWQTELLEKSYFDNNILVGMLKYKADRHEERYDQTAASEDEFHKAIYFYDEALKRSKSKKAMAALHRDIGYVCSRYKSDNKNRLVEFYKKGFLHARRGLQIMSSVNRIRQELGKVAYRYEEDSADVTSNLQRSYGNNLTGYIYNLYLNKNYKGVVGLKKVTLDVGFDWENKEDVLLLFAESAKELASASIKNEVAYRRYKAMALSAGSRAFKYQLKRFGGKPPAGFDQGFCKVFNAYWNYLDSFGELITAKDLENRYGRICPAGGAAAAPAVTE
jgi:hypothetical protein